MFKADPKRHPSCSHLMLLPRAASLAPLGVFSTPSGGPGPPGPLLFSVFCFSKRPPARHPEAARPPTDPEIKNARPYRHTQPLRDGHRVVHTQCGLASTEATGPRASVSLALMRMSDVEAPDRRRCHGRHQSQPQKARRAGGVPRRQWLPKNFLRVTQRIRGESTSAAGEASAPRSHI